MVIFSFVIACSYSKTNEKERLLEVVNEYWNAVVKADWDTAYEYEYPLLKKLVSRETYVFRRGNPMAHIVGYEIGDVFFKKPDEAIVNLKLRVKLVVPGNSKPAEIILSVKDRWYKIKNKWYHVPRKVPKGGRG